MTGMPIEMAIDWLGQRMDHQHHDPLLLPKSLPTLNNMLALTLAPVGAKYDLRQNDLTMTTKWLASSATVSLKTTMSCADCSAGTSSTCDASMNGLCVEYRGTLLQTVPK